MPYSYYSWLFYFLSFLSREHKDSLASSPNPSPRKSLEEKEILSQQEKKVEYGAKKTSPVAKIRQFVGVENDTDAREAPEYANQKLKKDLLDEISTGRNICFMILG